MTQPLTLNTNRPEKYIQLMLDKTKNNKELALTIFIKLFEELPKQLTTIHNALKNQHLAEAKDITHMLHGSASFCGLLAIQNPAKDLEISLINVDIEAAKNHFIELQRHVADLTNHQAAILAILNNLQ
jgi:HPt (histidine-containing phosphotransfer) domain-containing protein